jgi:hypothetical protein
VIAAEARRMVQYWGLASVESVAARVRALTSSPVAGALPARVVAELPLVCWLDGAGDGGAGAGGGRSWFSLRGHASGLDAAVAKVFRVAARVTVGDLKAALAKGLRGMGEVPPAVFRRCLTQIAGCALDGDVVRRASPPTEPLLDGPEAALVRILGDAGGELAVTALRERARSDALPRTTVRRLLEMSPLFVHAPGGLVQLIGDRSDGGGLGATGGG